MPRSPRMPGGNGGSVPVQGEERARRARELRLRIVSALVMVPLALLCLWWGGPVWLGLVAVLTAGCLFEWRALCHQGGASWRVLVAGAAMIVLAGAALAGVRALPGTGAANTLFLLACVWCSDIGAFAAGRAIGGRRLAPTISPGKTWAGALGGLLTATVAGAAIAAATDGGTLTGASAAAALSIAAQAGDLVESGMKRRFGVKDSGRLIPGHGGLLDRLDGLIAAAPIAAGLAMASTGGLVWGR